MDELEYDVVVYGTGLVSSLVASSLIKRLNYPFDGDSVKDKNKNNNDNKKVRVLNVDKYGEYGSVYRTLTFKQLLSLENSQLVNSHNDLYNVKLEVVKQYLSLSGSTEDNEQKLNQMDNKLYYDLYPFNQTFDKLTSSDFLSENQEKNSKQNEKSENKDKKRVKKDNEDKEKEQKDEGELNVTENKTVQKEGNNVKDEFEGKVKNLFENSNLYNIDLYPRLILNNSLFFKYLINSNIYKQLQLCTNNSSNVLYLFENDLHYTTNEDNDKVEDKDMDTGRENNNKKYEELMYDKNTIFRSNFLTNVEKRLLYRFLFHPNSVRSFDVDTKKESKIKKKEKNEDKEDKKQEGTTENEEKEQKDDGKENKVNLENKTFEEYLRESGLTYKLMNLVNYGMCFNQKQLSDENPSNLYEEMYKLNQYIKAYGFGKDTKGINDVKNCFVYCLYGLSNLVQFICRLNSLYQCHHMLSNTVLSVSVYDKNKDKEDRKDNEDEDMDEKQNEGEENKVDKNRILMKLDNYKVYTKYIVSEYDLTGVVEEFVPLENREKNYLLESDNNNTSSRDIDNSMDNNMNKKVLVVSVISNKKIFDSFNVCVVIPGRNDSSLDSNRDNRRDRENRGLEGLGNEEENPIYVIQTCRDTLTAPEGMYVLYFTTLVEGDVYNRQIDISSLFSNNEDYEDSTECNSNDNYNMEDKDYKDREGNTNNNTSSRDNSRYCKYKELKRVLSLYEYFVNDLSSIVFLSYTTYDNNNKIQLIGLDNNMNKKVQNKEENEQKEDEGKENKVNLKMIDNYYSNDNILYLSNKLYVSDQVTDQLLRMYKAEDKDMDTGREKKLVAEEEQKDDGKENKVNLENYLKYNDEEEDDEFSLNCDFLSDLIDKFF